MIKIAFHTPQICIRGTSIAIYDYANYNELILGNKSIIITPLKNKESNDIMAFLKFSNRFQVLFYENNEEMERLIRDCDILYCIKYGKQDGVVSKNIKTVIHCVFDMSEPHGNVYAAVSKTLAEKFNNNLYVPHMVSLQPSITKNNFREILNIPKDALVFGRHGGMDTFNLDFAREIIKKVVRDFNNIYFIFVNTPQFDTHPHIIFLNKIVDLEEKNRFINTCDAGLECGTLGHTFGLSLAEFSVNNKPNIVFNGPVWNTAHIEILGDKGIYFKNEEELYNIFSSFNKTKYENQDNNAYKDYSPSKIMKIFKEVFID